MFKKHTEGKLDNADTLIGLNAIFNGNIETKGTLKVDGKLNGDLKVNGEVFIGNSALVIGNICANEVYLSGTVEGNIIAEGGLKILSTAKLLGDIQVGSFISEKGGLFIGKCSMLENMSQYPQNASNTPLKKLAVEKDLKVKTVIEQIFEDRNIEVNKNL